MKVKRESEVAQPCLTLRDPMDCSLPSSSILGIFQARVLEWVAIAFSASHILKSINHRKSKRISEEHVLCFTDYIKAFDCVDHNKLWKILWTEEPGRLQSMGSLRVGHD